MADWKTPPLLGTLPLMTPWYGPKALTQTGLRSVVSTIIGEYADQRIMQAAIDDVTPAILTSRYDFSALPGTGAESLPVDADGALWIDYMADTGDGFDSTYAMARLLAASNLEVAGTDRPLPAGEVLFLGGDQAYPYASKEEYEKRFLQPFNFTTWHATAGAAPERKVFVLPGNHDWYDGLSAFDRLFCRRRDGISDGTTFGRYHGEQHRSYWAVRLPHDWWIWGLDIQLTANLDAGQMRYFSQIANTLPLGASEQAKLIICLATPSWIEGSESGKYEDYTENLRRILNLAIDRANVCLMLAGDWHHYARYFSPVFRLNCISSGGGGAYLAPTHQLPSRLNVPWKTSSAAPLQKVPFTLNAPSSTDPAVIANTAQEPRPEAVYPSRDRSRRLSWWIPAFPILNPTFCLALGFLYFLMYWFYTSAFNITPICTGSIPDPTRPFCVAAADPSQGLPGMRMDTILIKATTLLSPLEHFGYLFASSRFQPALAFILLAVLGMIWGFLAGSKRPWVRLFESVVFWLMHVFVMAYMSDGILSYMLESYPTMSSWQRIAITSAFMWLVGGAIAGTMCGLYLFAGNRIFRTQHDNAFSSLRIAGYKNFLRMRVTKDELTIYPIGLDRVPNRRGWRQPTPQEVAAGETGAYVPKTPLKPRLIEKPVVIRAGDIVQMPTRPPQPQPQSSQAAPTAAQAAPKPLA